MSSNLEPKGEESVIKFCPLCGIEFEDAGSSNKKQKCGSCEKEFSVRVF